MPLEAVLCTHCQSPCGLDAAMGSNNEPYCCLGCREVRQLLLTCGLESIYQLADQPLPQAVQTTRSWIVLDDPGVKAKLLDLETDNLCRVRFKIPSVRCAACLGILEELPRIVSGVTSSRLNFARQELALAYNPKDQTLSQIASMLEKLGYAPEINLGLKSAKTFLQQRPLVQLAVAFFCFGNIMLLAFPEYLALISLDILKPHFASFLMLLQLGLSLPVFVIAAQVWGGVLKHPRPFQSLDLPIFFGICVIYLISLKHILIDGTPGYLDSLSGLVLFLLVGRQIQSITYERLLFDRDYRDYLPLGVDKLDHDGPRQVWVQTLKPEDEILLPSQSIVPCDCLVQSPSVIVDQSFITGEQDPVQIQRGMPVFAGSKVLSASAQLKVQKEVSQSYICGIWQEQGDRNANTEPLFQTSIASWFTPLLFVVASLGFLAWLPAGLDRALLVFCSVLIVACPCALALAAPIGLGLAVRQLAARGLYLRNIPALESLSSCKTIVFDKTGTLTSAASSSLITVHSTLNKYRTAVKSLAHSSLHPLSQKVYSEMGGESLQEVTQLESVPGSGIRGLVEGIPVAIGSCSFTGLSLADNVQGTVVSVRAGDESAVFQLKGSLRPGLKEMLGRLRQNYSLKLCSGDRKSAVDVFSDCFPNAEDRTFEQTPPQKAEVISLLETHSRVLMLGDGVNDCGAFEQATCSLAVIEKSSSLFPSCSGIIDASMLQYLPEFLALAENHIRTVKFCLALSLAYNCAGLFLALTGQLQPIVCAVLMPLSSLSVVIGSTILSFKYSSRSGVPWKSPFSSS